MANLLIVTQKVDKNDDVLGFFHRWIEEFAKHCESIIVICLQRGEYNLPENVRVLSLGKEKFIGNSRNWHIIRRFAYLYRFYKYILRERKNYDAVFVHMNSIYVVLGGIFWRIQRKKIFLWYNHQFGNLITRIGIGLADKVFYTSPFAFASKFKKSKIMPAGIDTEIFKRNENIQKIPNSILYLGRISLIKNIDILIEAANLLDKEGINFILNIVGEPGEKDLEYFKKIKKIAENLEKKGKIKFLDKVPNHKTPEIYNQNEILVNLTPSGSFDKVILEAMACGVLVLVCNKSFEEVFPPKFLFEENNRQDLAKKLKLILDIPQDEKLNYGRQFRDYVVENHNLAKLTQKIISHF